MSDIVFPQTGDPDYGELFALLLGQSNTTDFVGDGLEISVDTGANEATIAAGTCYIHVPSATLPDSTETVTDLGYVVEIESQTVSLPFSGTNHLSIDPDYSQPDTVSIGTYELAGDVPEDSLYIAAVDRSTGDVTRKNESPSIDASDLTVFGVASIGADLTVTGDIVLDGTLQSGDGSGIIGETLPTSVLSDDSITVTTSDEITGGGTVTLGGTIDIGVDVPVTTVFGRTGDVTAQSGDYTHAQIASTSSDDHHTYPVPNSGLQNDSVTVSASGDLTGGGTVSLGDSISLSADIPSRYTDGEAISAVDGEVSVAANSVSALDNVVDTNVSDISSLSSNKLDIVNYTPETDTHDRYTDSEAITAVDGQVDNASTSVAGLDDQVSTNTSDISSLETNKFDASNYNPEADTHSRYTDGEAITAVDGEVSVAGSVSALDSQVSTNTSDISSLETNKFDASNYNPEADTHSRYADSEAITAVDGEVDNAATSVSGLDNQVSTNVGNISSLQSNKLDSSAYDPEGDTHSRYTDSEAITAVDGEVSAAATTVSGLDSQVSTNTSNISSNDTDISNLQSNKLDTSNYNPEADTHSRYEDSEAISAVNGEVDNASTSVSGLDDQVATNTSNISTNTTDISNLQSNKLDTSAYTPIADVDGEVNNAASSVASLDDQVATNISNISSNDTDISNLQSNKLDTSAYTPIADVDGEVNNAASSVASLDDQVATNISNISSNDTDISNLQSNKLDASAYNPEADTHSKTTSGEIDHNQTTNRTHNGDSLTPSSVDVSDTLALPQASPGDQADEVGELAITADGELLVAR